MEWQIIIAIVIAIPVTVFPITAIWYLDLGGIFTAFKEARARRADVRRLEKCDRGDRVGTTH